MSGENTTASLAGRCPAVQAWIDDLEELRNNPPDVDEADQAVIGRAQLAIDDALAEACMPPPRPRCEVCDWPLASTASEGCVPGNCGYRPDHGTEEYYRIQKRRDRLAEADHQEGLGE